MPRTQRATRAPSDQSRSSTPKCRVRDLLSRMPDNCTIDDVQYQIYVMELIDRRLRLAERGEFLTQEQVERRLQKWLRK